MFGGLVVGHDSNAEAAVGAGQDNLLGAAGPQEVADGAD